MRNFSQFENSSPTCADLHSVLVSITMQLHTTIFVDFIYCIFLFIEESKGVFFI